MRSIRWVGIGVIVAGLACPDSLLSAQASGVASAAISARDGDRREERSAQYGELQTRLARGWNTWDVHSVAAQVLLPEGLAIYVGMKHNTRLYGDAFLGDALIGRFGPDAEVVTPGPHA